MSTNLDTAILIGKETTYGTAVTLTNAYEGQADSFKRAPEYLESRGFRGGMQAHRSDRRKPVDMGGEGTLEVDFLDKGMGFLVQALLGATTGPTQIAATTAYKQVHTTATDAPGDSFTVQVQRVTASAGTVVPFTHRGCTVTNWSISQDTSGYLKASLGFDFQTVEKTTAAGTPSYPASTCPFDWTQAVVSVDGTATDVSSMSFDADLGLKTDRRFLRGSALKKMPVRNSLPSFSGSMESEFENSTIYDLFVSGEIVPIVFTWTGGLIEDGYNHEVKLTLEACQITGDSPEASLDDLTSQPISFMVLHNGSDPAAQLEITSTDTAL